MIKHLILFDLFGMPHPCVRSYFPDTACIFDTLVSAKMRLCDVDIIDTTVEVSSSPLFSPPIFLLQ